MNWASSVLSDRGIGGLASPNVKFGSKEEITVKRTAKRKRLDLKTPIDLEMASAL